MEHASSGERRVRLVEATIRDLAHERVYILDSDRSVIFTNDGRERSVLVPDTLARGRLIVHNHPNGESFSRADVQIFLQVGASEFRVVTDQYRYRLRHGGGMKWGDVERLIARLYFEETEQAAQGVRRGVTSVDVASRGILHRVWERAGDVVGWDYRREELSE